MVNIFSCFYAVIGPHVWYWETPKHPEKTRPADSLLNF